MQCQTVIQKVTFVRFIKMPLFLEIFAPDNDRKRQKRQREKLKKIKQRNGTFRSHVNGKGEKKFV